MRFTVVIPVFNRAATVFPTLESVRQQTFGDFECLVIDDGSADGEALRNVVQELHDSRFRYISRPNGGGGAARNTGIDCASGSHIALLDSDDLFLPRKLEVMAKAVDADADAVWYSSALVDRGSRRVWVRPSYGIGENQHVAEYLFVDNQFIATPTIVLPSELARRVRFDDGLQKQQDLDFCVRLYAAGAIFRFVDEPLVRWVDHKAIGRVSHASGHDAPARLLEQLRPLMTERSVIGYRATVLAYYLAPVRPWAALRYIAEGLLRGGVSFRVTVRQLLRSFLPQAVYRRIIDGFVWMFGRSG